MNRPNAISTFLSLFVLVGALNCGGSDNSDDGPSPQSGGAGGNTAGAGGRDSTAGGTTAGATSSGGNAGRAPMEGGTSSGGDGGSDAIEGGTSAGGAAAGDTNQGGMNDGVAGAAGSGDAGANQGGAGPSPTTPELVDRCEAQCERAADAMCPSAPTSAECTAQCSRLLEQPLCRDAIARLLDCTADADFTCNANGEPTVQGCEVAGTAVALCVLANLPSRSQR